MRARNIKPGFFRNEQLMQVAPLGRLLFAGLWCLADREGRLLDRPNQIKWDVLPADDCDIGALLDDLARRGFICRYEADGKQCIAIPNFRQHQKPHPNEKALLLPPPPPDTAPAQKRTSIGLNDEYMNDEHMNPIPSQPKRSKYDLPLLTDDWRPPTTEDEAVSRIAIAWYTLTGEMPSLSDRQHLRRALRRGQSEQTLIDLLTSQAATAQAKPLRLSSILAAELAKTRSGRTTRCDAVRTLTERTTSSDAVRTLTERAASSDAVRTLTERAASAEMMTLSDAGTSFCDKPTLTGRIALPAEKSRTLQDSASPASPPAEAPASPPAEAPAEVPAEAPAAHKTADFFTAKDGNTRETRPRKPSGQYIDWQEGFFRRR